MDTETIALAYRFLTGVLPRAARSLGALRARAEQIADPDIRREACASIRDKAFHVHGGCILATFLEPKHAGHYVDLVAAFETAVDYLDNLCDRIGAADEQDFRALHESLIDAVTPGAALRSYFRHRSTNDGGYLNELVTRSQRLFAQLPAFSAVAPGILDVTVRYCELQAVKHLVRGERERRCELAFSTVDPSMAWWEGAAASGSTMATFALLYAALQPRCDSARATAVHQAYFPFFTGTHILLDYFIDQAEDAQHAELNFVACYPSRDAAATGIARIASEALRRANALSDAKRHAFALRAMAAFYLSRPKVRDQGLQGAADQILSALGVDAAPAVAQPLLELYGRLAG